LLRVESDRLQRVGGRGGRSDDTWRNPYSIVRECRNHSRELNRRDADLLPNRDGPNGNLRPFVNGLRHAACLAGQFDPGLLAKPESANVFVEPVFAEAQREFYGADVA